MMNIDFQNRRRLLQTLAATPFAACAASVFADCAVSEESAQSKEHNPILPGTKADPEVLWSKKDGRVYLYPTSESNGFRAFSSDNLVDWRDDGIVLSGKNISWAKGGFWAPSIIEKEVEGGYKYYFYFVAEEKIGVAVGDSPTGPFVDSGAALIDASLRPEGARGVEIDPFVFCDPVSGKNYLYWGNSYLGVAELNDDMVSLKRDTIRLITPPDFFEGTYVFYRDGLYYLTWSKHDTRSIEYQVWVATSKSPLGPFVSPEKDAIILRKVPEKEIWGPGHHSFLFLPNGEQYIFYHRLCLPLGKQPWARETCVDRFFFREDGSIAPIVPTREGISTPVNVKSLRGE
ncbi:MAG: family 43 glycosylhydrolase [Thermoguttaceae bacterium]|nr:family 43 glycosylhydrolase [Thermoguttaceae bacterium]